MFPRQERVAGKVGVLVTRVAGDLQPDPGWEEDRFVFAEQFRLRDNETVISAFVLIHDPGSACPF